jgi:hypothetical protein
MPLDPHQASGGLARFPRWTFSIADERVAITLAPSATDSTGKLACSSRLSK